jgi:hypothetical protein
VQVGGQQQQQEGDPVVRGSMGQDAFDRVESEGRLFVVVRAQRECRGVVMLLSRRIVAVDARRGIGGGGRALRRGREPE